MKRYKLNVYCEGESFTEWFKKFDKAVEYGLFYTARYAAQCDIIDRVNGKHYDPYVHREA